MRNLVLLVVSLMVFPLSLAHEPAGTPDFTCQTPAEWNVHDYAGAGVLSDVSDNNLEECGTTYGLFIAGTPECRELEDRLGAGPGNPAWVLLCNTDRPADYDGDLEFALGGAVLAAENGDGATSGSLVCLGTVGHHSNDVSASDVVFGPVSFTVSADASLPGTVPPGEPDCGDGVIRPCDSPGELDLLSAACNPDDHRVQCIGSCSVPFSPGADGTYIVVVCHCHWVCVEVDGIVHCVWVCFYSDGTDFTRGTLGHIWTT